MEELLALLALLLADGALPQNVGGMRRLGAANVAGKRRGEVCGMEPGPVPQGPGAERGTARPAKATVRGAPVEAVLKAATVPRPPGH